MFVSPPIHISLFIEANHKPPFKLVQPLFWHFCRAWVFNTEIGSIYILENMALFIFIYKISADTANTAQAATIAWVHRDRFNHFPWAVPNCGPRNSGSVRPRTFEHRKHEARCKDLALLHFSAVSPWQEVSASTRQELQVSPTSQHTGGATGSRRTCKAVEFILWLTAGAWELKQPGTAGPRCLPGEKCRKSACTAAATVNRLGLTSPFYYLFLMH